ncbi:MAG: hypothetical protein QW544_01795 [Candidatus Caldarchaeum sp.]
MAEELTLSAELGFPVRWYVEGKVRFLAPVFPTTEHGEPTAPKKSPVFYNPFSSLSRDLTVLLARVFDRKAVAAEPLAGSGVRSVRLLLETSNVSKTFLNDVNPNAVKVIRLNAEHNNVVERVEISEGDAAVFLTAHSSPGTRFYYVDVDPVGPPVKFVENSLRACETGGYVGVSATDLASLVGNHPKTCLRKYGVLAGKSFFAKEAALRLLASHVILRGCSFNIAPHPILSVYHRHFVRVFFRVLRGRSRCISLLRSVGWIQACSSLHINLHPIATTPGATCTTCGGKASVIGPAWLGPLHDRTIAEKMLRQADQYPEASKTLRKITEEVDVVGFYPVDQIARVAGVKPPSPSALAEVLRKNGFKASLSHVEPTGVKTNAPLTEVLRLAA